ncbi:MAG: UDP-2,3-diacylglucosamine diphosphatase, partial [Pirellulales bacterium]
MTPMKCAVADSQRNERHVRSLFVSDVHLGCRYAQPENFLALLESIRPDELYILGDFLDGWKLSAAWRWMPVYTRIVKRLLQLAKTGTSLFYTPGNHDAFLRCAELRHIIESVGLNVKVRDEFVFQALDGRRYLVTHGDRFDLVEMHYQWLSVATSYIYEPILSFNWWTTRALGRQGSSPYAMCAFLKDKVKTAVRFISSFERELFQHARDRGCDGVICGHIHSPKVLSADDMMYLNTGDWVENCTA